MNRDKVADKVHRLTPILTEFATRKEPFRSVEVGVMRYNESAHTLAHLEQLAAAACDLLDAESPHMCHRNKKEAAAYRRIRNALTMIEKDCP